MNLLDGIRTGMTRAEVVMVFGPPDDVGCTSGRHRVPQIYKYGEIELHFEPEGDGKLWMAYTEDQNGNGVVLLR